MRKTVSSYIFFKNQRNKQKPQHSPILIFHHGSLRQHRTIPALRLKHRSGGCGTASALPKCSIMSGCGTRIVLRGQKPLALCDRCPCFGSLFPPLAALTFAASSIICAFGLAAAAPRSPYRHLELCGIALIPIVRFIFAFWGRLLHTAHRKQHNIHPQNRIDNSRYDAKHNNDLEISA